MQDCKVCHVAEWILREVCHGFDKILAIQENIISRDVSLLL